MSQPKERLFLLDGTALAYRAHFAFLRARLTDTKGRPTGAIYGFVATLLKLIREENPDHLGCCFDPPGPTFRHEMYEPYKATREKMDDDLAAQLPLLRDVVRAFNIPVLEVPGFEADDVLATIADRAAKEGIDAYIVTGDKDLCQSVEPGVFIYNILKPGQDTEVLDEAGVEASWGVPPTRVADVLALMGDSSDNVPGVPGVGKKTARRLMSEYDTVEAVLDAAAAGKIPQKKLSQNLVEYREQAELSYELVLVKRDVPVDVTFEDLRLGDPDSERLHELFVDLNFTRLLQEIASDEPPAEEIERNYVTVRTKDDLDTMLATLRDAELIAFDTETTALDPMEADLVGFSFSTAPGNGWYVPLNLEPPVLGGDGDEAVTRVIDALRPLLEDASVRKCGQNAKYDMLALRRAGIHVQGLVLDTMIASFCLDPGQRQHGLDALSLRLFNYRKIPTSELIGSGRNQITMDQVEVDRVSEYAAEDADFTLRIARTFEPRLAEDEDLGALYRDVEMPLVPVLTDMEWEGIRLDTDMLGGLSAELAKRAGTLEREVCEMAGEAFNVNSPKQLGEVLFERMNIQGRKHVRKTKTGWATDERTLRKFESHPIVEKLLRFRSLTKLRGTYTEALPKLVNPHTGRVHTSYSQVAAVTGRLASSDPNLQNIPIRSEDGREIRRAFVARDEGWQLLAADYSQIELRVLAHLSGDEHLCSAFEAGDDIHRETAARIFGMAPQLVTTEIRSRAKAINFGIIYGMGATRLAQDTGISRKEATDFIANYFKAYPGVRDFVETLKSKAREQGFVTTLLGRRRPLQDMLESSNQRVQAAVDNVAVNTPIQGSAADIIKLAMLRVHAAMGEADIASRMVLQVHDELVFDVAPDELETVQTLAREHMEAAYALRVPLVVDMGWGHDWLTAH